MPIPKAMRRRTPSRIRDNRLIRAGALATGLIGPRPMHSPAEADVLRRLAAGAACVVELGVYEGSSAFVLVDALDASSELHLVDPYTDESGSAMLPGMQGTPLATRLAVARHARHGPRVVWHVARSQNVGRGWTGCRPDLVFIDGDHSPEGCQEDWDVWHEHVRPGGYVAFHDARDGRADGSGSPGPTQVVNVLFRGAPPADWHISDEVDTLVVVRRTQQMSERDLGPPS